MGNWWKQLIQWIKSWMQWVMGKKPVALKPTIEAHWRTVYGDLYRLHRSTPEAIPHATYRFIPAYRRGHGHLLLTCDRYIDRRNRVGDGVSPSVQGIRNGSPAPGHPNPSHRLSLSQVETVGNLVKARIIFSYPVDFVGPKGHVRIWQATDGKIITPDLTSRVDSFTDRNAILITAQLAELLLNEYDEKIQWEEEIHKLASSLGASHIILLRSPRSPP